MLNQLSLYLNWLSFCLFKIKPFFGLAISYNKKLK